ncbi:uncharacterized protein CMC5_013770 [Chondromyces crocatus]|uniref:Uncharacterized protein n=1 Tax=Chondromyces crocatus TaxID=52 RepID=A0A0K1E8P2_CHOCO|nr:uncharacterized protein CMC5_013770 [Chondromyces crocatus]
MVLTWAYAVGCAATSLPWRGQRMRWRWVAMMVVVRAKVATMAAVRVARAMKAGRRVARGVLEETTLAGISKALAGWAARVQVAPTRALAATG